MQFNMNIVRRGWSQSLKWISIILLVLVSIPVMAITTQERDSVLNLPLFNGDSLLNIELKTDLAALINDIGESRKYHDCELSVMVDGDSGIDQFEVKVKTRGNFRRRKQNCNFPPLRFKIPTDEAKGTVFEGQNKLKYVSHCQSFIDAYEQHTVEEYLVYKMYNLISEHSYRVRLAQITFIDINSNDTIKKYGFFLEDKDDVATRNGKKIMRFKNVKQYDVLRKDMVMLSLFQLMIGNSDWDVGRLHNIDIMSVSEHSIPIAVPFDFDWSAIIGHSYYIPDPRIDPESKYQRIYKGYRWSQEEFATAFANFQDLKEPFMQLISDCPYLNKENQQRLMAYIAEFYELIGSRRDVRVVIEKNSPKIPTTR